MKILLLHLGIKESASTEYYFLAFIYFFLIPHILCRCPFHTQRSYKEVWRDKCKVAVACEVCVLGVMPLATSGAYCSCDHTVIAIKEWFAALEIYLRVSIFFTNALRNFFMAIALNPRKPLMKVS